MLCSKPVVNKCHFVNVVTYFIKKTNKKQGIYILTNLITVGMLSLTVGKNGIQEKKKVLRKV